MRGPVPEPALQTAVILPLEEARKLFTGDISELQLLDFINCLSLNNVVAISLLLSASCTEIRLLIGFHFQLCATWLQTCT